MRSPASCCATSPNAVARNAPPAQRRQGSDQRRRASNGVAATRGHAGENGTAAENAALDAGARAGRARASRAMAVNERGTRRPEVDLDEEPGDELEPAAERPRRTSPASSALAGAVGERDDKPAGCRRCLLRTRRRVPLELFARAGHRASVTPLRSLPRRRRTRARARPAAVRAGAPASPGSRLERRRRAAPAALQLRR